MKLLRTGRIRLDGKRSSPGALVRIGQRVEVPAGSVPRRREATTMASAAASGRAPESVRRDPPAPVVLEDRDLLVVAKPAGVVVHGGSGHEESLLDRLIAYAAPSAEFQPALVHRLDRDTSGLLVLARTGLAQRRLAASLRAGAFEKTYLALVRGRPAPPEGEIRAALRKERFPDGLERMAVVPPEPGAGGELPAGALPALTRYRTVRALGPGGPTLLELRPETGRTHQLRVHCAFLGHPIALDPRYGDRAFDREIRQRSGLGRLFLHAARLAFPHPRTGARVALEAPLPPDLAGALARLGMAGT